MKKLIVAFVLVSLLAVTMVFSFGLDKANCQACWDQGKHCKIDRDCMGYCICTEGMSTLVLTCEQIPVDF